MITRRELLAAGLAAWSARRAALRWIDPRISGDSDRILVVVQLQGGNDGLNTVVPWQEDEYHRARPRLGLRGAGLHPLDDRFALHPGLERLARLYQEGHLAVVQGCGVQRPSFSHTTAMSWWNSGVPHRVERTGWLGRFADLQFDEPVPGLLVGIADLQVPVLDSDHQVAVVLRDESSLRSPSREGAPLLGVDGPPSAHRELAFVERVERAARKEALAVEAALSSGRSDVDYGSDSTFSLDLRKVAALIRARLSARVYVVEQRSYDTHASQADTHAILLRQLAYALYGFQRDLEAADRARDVCVLVYSEFGRRFAENQSAGTDHGTAGPVLVLGEKVSGGLHGSAPSLTELDEGNLVATVDFRRVYATILENWLGCRDSAAVLRGRFETLPIFPERA